MTVFLYTRAIHHCHLHLPVSANRSGGLLWLGAVQPCSNSPVAVCGVGVLLRLLDAGIHFAFVGFDCRQFSGWQPDLKAG